MDKAKKTFYRYCLVPMCKNTIRSTPDKLFFPVPRDANRRKQWCKVMRRDNVSSLSCLYCCEDHFNNSGALVGSATFSFGAMTSFITKLKNVALSTPKPPLMEANPILQYFEVGNECSTAGPGLAWKVHDALRKSDGKECSVFVLEKALAEKIYKPTKHKKEKDLMIDCIKRTVLMLDRVRHPKMLQVIHSLEEGATTIAFATEPILASLHDILAWQENNIPPPDDGPPPVEPRPTSHSPPPLVGDDKADEPPKVKNYWFLEIEIRYGLLQIIDALNYLHYTAHKVHRNVSPHVILVCKRGTWKLFGLDFVENLVSIDPNVMINVPPYNIKTSKIAQPHLDYMAPEAQINGQCNMLSDMFSLGLVVCSVFNQGRPLVQAHCNPLSYIKQVEHITDQLHRVMPRIPKPLQEAVSRMLSKDPHPRPTTQLLPLTKYFKCSLDRCYSEPAINALQFLDVVTTKDVTQRTHFYNETLMKSMPHIPEKLIWMHVWPALQVEVRTGEVVAAVLTPIMYLTEKCTQAQFEDQILPTLKQIYCRNLMSNPKQVGASIAFLENAHVLLQRCKNNQEVYSEVVPLMVTALDNLNNTCQQTAALVALQNCAEYVSDEVIHRFVLAKIRIVLERNCCDVKIINLILCFFEKVLYRLERQHLIDHVIPTMLAMKLSDSDIISRVVKLYKIMITHEKFGLTAHLMAQRMLPTLAPHAINPTLTMEQYHALIEVLYDLLDHIDDIQRPVVAGAVPDLPRIERSTRAMRQRRSIEAIKDPPPFNIPNLRVERSRKTSSAEDMARKASMSGAPIQPTPSQSSVGTGIKKISQWFFGSNNSTNSNNNDNNFLRVASNVFPNRRLSDNTLLNPRGRSAAPSCASSPGGSPGAAGLPTRRHSSIGPQERRGSHLSPPTAHQGRGRGGSGSSLSVPAPHPVGGSMPNTATSVPQLRASIASVAGGPGSRRPSACASRRPSACPSTASRVSHASAHSHASASIMQQIHTGVSQLFTGRT